MEDLFKNTFLCKECNKKMKLTSINKNGFNLRAVECKDCNNRIIHPNDEKEFEEFKKLKQEHKDLERDRIEILNEMKYSLLCLKDVTVKKIYIIVLT